MSLKNFISKYYPSFIVIYTLVIVYLLFFWSVRDRPLEPFSIKYNAFETIYLYIINVLPYYPLEFIENIFGNIVIFIPYGFLGLVFPKLNNLGVLLIVFFIIINGVEFAQYFTQRGYADIDDVILNTLGCLIGFAFYRLIFRK